VILAHLIQTASSLPSDTSALKSSISALESSISALESEIARLESSSTPWEHWAWFFTVLVLLGVLSELWVIRHDWRDELNQWAIWYFIGVIRSPDRPSIVKLLIEVASVLLIGIGIAGELGTGIEIALINGALRGNGAKLRSKGDELRSASDQLLALVTKEARDAADSADSAKTSAKEAQGKLNGVSKQAADLTLRMGAASKKMDDLEEDIRIQGPRSKLLIDGEKTFVELLKPFKLQKIIMVTCSPRQSAVQTDEEFGFEVTLLNRLAEPRPGSPPGAGWDVRSGGAYSCKASGVGGGVWVLYGSPALKAAAEALSGALNKLKISTNTTLVGEDASGYARQKRHPDDFMALCELVASDPTEIYILTGEHPRAFNPQPKPQ
jgi:hypothetical protein